MIFGKLWRSLQAQLNKIANLLWTADPIAQMQYEYDRAVDQLKEGRVGLEQYRALVERVTRQVANNQKTVASLEARIKAYLQSGDRETAGKFALELQKAKKELEENEGQLKMHEQAYNNNLMKIKHASGKLADLHEVVVVGLFVHLELAFVFFELFLGFLEFEGKLAGRLSVAALQVGFDAGFQAGNRFLIIGDLPGDPLDQGTVLLQANAPLFELIHRSVVFVLHLCNGIRCPQKIGNLVQLRLEGAPELAKDHRHT